MGVYFILRVGGSKFMTGECSNITLNDLHGCMAYFPFWMVTFPVIPYYAYGVYISLPECAVM